MHPILASTFDNKRRYFSNFCSYMLSISNFGSLPIVHDLSKIWFFMMVSIFSWVWYNLYCFLGIRLFYHINPILFFSNIGKWATSILHLSVFIFHVCACLLSSLYSQLKYLDRRSIHRPADPNWIETTKIKQKDNNV